MIDYNKYMVIPPLDELDYVGSGWYWTKNTSLDIYFAWECITYHHFFYVTELDSYLRFTIRHLRDEKKLSITIARDGEREYNKVLFPDTMTEEQYFQYSTIHEIPFEREALNDLTELMSALYIQMSQIPEE